jgi:anti-sigma factor RsiW
MGRPLVTSRCPDSGTLQDFLEDLLAPEARLAVERHLGTCDRCGQALARLDHVFSSLGRLPLEAPAAGLAERVLDEVLPDRRSVRWMRRLGAGYAWTFAACVVAIGAWVAQPAGRSFLTWVAAESSARVLHSLMFVVHTASFVALSLSGGWGIVSAVGAKVSPFARALFVVADHGLIQLALGVSAVLCVSLLWWLRPRAGRPRKGMPHVGVLGI